MTIFHEVIVDELPSTCGDCGFHHFETDPDGPDCYYCKALDFLGKDDFLGDHLSDHDKNCNKIRSNKCPLKIKGDCPNNEIKNKMLKILLTEKTPEIREQLQEVFCYFLNIKGDEKNDSNS